MEKEKQTQTRYPWHAAPDWANYAVTDWDGTRFWCENRPVSAKIEWRILSGKYAQIFDPCSDFAESLETRPN